MRYHGAGIQQKASGWNFELVASQLLDFGAKTRV